MKVITSKVGAVRLGGRWLPAGTLLCRSDGPDDHRIQEARHEKAARTLRLLAPSSREPLPGHVCLNRALRFCLFFFLIVGVAEPARSDRTLAQMYLTARTIRDWLPSNIEGIVQTKDGYLPFGTDNVLFRFDGKRFEHFRPSSGEDVLPTFRRPHAFMQSYLFKALCLLGGISILWLAHRMRLKHVTQRVQSRIYERVTERTRIARDLHDNFFQSIQGLFLRFHTATSLLPSSEPTRAIFEDALRQSDDVMWEGQKLLLKLQCSAGESRDLPSALAEAGRQLQEFHSCKFNLIVNGKALVLHPIVCDELSQIGREALSNAFRHSHASQIEVEVHFEANQLQLRIRDDGEGVDRRILEQVHRSGHWGLPGGHPGLSGMRERARKIGAHLDLCTRPGAGTDIELRIPAALAYVPQNERGIPWLRRFFRDNQKEVDSR